MRQATDAAVMEAMGRTAQVFSELLVSASLVYSTFAVDTCNLFNR